MDVPKDPYSNKHWFAKQTNDRLLLIALNKYIAFAIYRDQADFGSKLQKCEGQIFTAKTRLRGQRLKHIGHSKIESLSDEPAFFQR